MSITIIEQRNNFIHLANGVELASQVIAKVTGANKRRSKDVDGVRPSMDSIAESVAARINVNLNNGGI